MKHFGSSLMAAMIFATLIIASGVATANAQDNATPVSGGRDMVRGTVVSIDNNQLVITTAKDNRMTFHLEQNAFMPINLTVGNEVEVTYWNSGGENVTNRILMAYPGAVGLASNQTGAGSQTGFASNEGGTYGRGSALRARNRAGQESYASSPRHRRAHLRGGETGNGRSALTGGETGNGRNVEGGETGNGAAMAQNNAGAGNAAGTARVPRTASPLPLLALAGLVSAAVGFGIRKLR